LKVLSAFMASMVEWPAGAAACEINFRSHGTTAQAQEARCGSSAACGNGGLRALTISVTTPYLCALITWFQRAAHWERVERAIPSLAYELQF
tara:strand:- start:250 stop:525 length:276 start_codon:yes stop_codon:yes gene_type:complete